MHSSETQSVDPLTYIKAARSSLSPPEPHDDFFATNGHSPRDSRILVLCTFRLASRVCVNFLYFHRYFSADVFFFTSAIGLRISCLGGGVFVVFFLVGFVGVGVLGLFFLFFWVVLSDAGHIKDRVIPLGSALTFNDRVRPPRRLIRLRPAVSYSEQMLTIALRV